jgi:hypothetical protein
LRIGIVESNHFIAFNRHQWQVAYVGLSSIYKSTPDVCSVDIYVIRKGETLDIAQPEKIIHKPQEYSWGTSEIKR